MLRPVQLRRVPPRRLLKQGLVERDAAEAVLAAGARAKVAANRLGERIAWEQQANPRRPRIADPVAVEKAIESSERSPVATTFPGVRGGQRRAIKPALVPLPQWGQWSRHQRRR